MTDALLRTLFIFALHESGAFRVERGILKHYRVIPRGGEPREFMHVMPAIVYAIQTWD